MQISKSGPGKTQEAIDLVKKNIGKIELSTNHRSRVNDIREQGWYKNVEAKGLTRRSIAVEDVQDQITEYAKKNIKDSKEILALVIMMCYWEQSIEKSSPTFFHAKSIVELLEAMSGPYYRAALLIYQAALYENANKEYWALYRLDNLSIVSKEQGDDYHAMSAWIKGCAHEAAEKYIKATYAFNEIGPDESVSYYAPAQAIIQFMAPLAKKEAEEAVCVML